MAKKDDRLLIQYDTKHLDEFFENQPPMEFIDELKSPVHKTAPLNFGSRKEKRDDEVDASGIYIKEYFPDPKGVLETVWADFSNFLKLCESKGERYPIIIKEGKTDSFEAYEINVAEDGVEIVSGDTEGVRRAIFYIEGELTKREGFFLKKGTVKRKPYIKDRVTRGFFSPTNRPPKNGDELFDDIDYYPDEYLNRLQHNGTNGLWIYTSFKALLTSSVIKEHGEGGEKRIEKLRSVVKKCARYGVKVYIFALEPMGFYDWEDLYLKYPEMLGSELIAGQHPICLRTEKGKEFMIEAVEKLFTLVPDLGGYLNITDGERFTTCSSSRTYYTCPRCGKYTRGENLAYNVDIIKEGIRRAGTGAQFISWTYGHRGWDFDNIRDYVKHAPTDVALMQNFDDMGYEEQLGKTRQAVDYWLSYVGPSILFETTGKAALEYNKTLWAKMQVCCSHELATVPYIPTPGIIFEKFKGARKYNVSGVLECWYFGNYPSIMNRASGEFAFMDDFSDKEGALFELVSHVWGETKAKTICKAFDFFEKGYKNYPINILFSYYGPMHDGICWDLQLIPKNWPLSRTWLLVDAPVGDRIGECLWNGHTLDEAIILCERICENWEKGLQLLDLDENAELMTLSRALGLLFNSGVNILNFYKLRKMLGKRQGDPKEILAEMRKIVEKEIENSKAMIPLCHADKRLGYHSEAEGFKFFPEKLERRISNLETLLKTEFSEVEKRIEEGLAPLEYYLGKADYIMKKGNPVDATVVNIGEDRNFAISYDDDNICLLMTGKKEDMFKFGFEFELFEPDTNMNLKDGILTVEPTAKSHQQVFGDRIEEKTGRFEVDMTENGDNVTYLVKGDRKKLGWTDNTPIKLRLQIGDSLWKEEDMPTYALGKAPLSPDEYGFLLTE
ncbi:MAG: hypothetical protein E7582_00485 [Ruminococcaceae bacterium]|nr:hypothetical protein [Oscillospiraceae bacterium]